jgi:hypothetical protein
MKDIFLTPVGEEWISEFNETVDSPVSVSDLEDAPSEIADYDEVRVWGTTQSEKKRPHFEQMEKGDIVFFYLEGKFFATGRVDMTFESREGGKALFDNEESSFIYTLSDFDRISLPREDLWDILGYSGGYFLRGFSRASDEAIDNILREYNSVEEAYQNLISEDEGEESDESDTETLDIEKDSTEEEEDEPSTHTEVQWKLIQIGLEHEYDVYVAKNDVNRTYEGNELSEECVDKLSLTGFSESVVDIIEYVDVIWLEDNHIVKMFEVESTTSIYSGILRMTDFTARVPNLAVDMYIVAPDKDEDNVRKQISRPTFQQVLGKNETLSLNYLSFEEVRDKYELVQRVGALREVF